MRYCHVALLVPLALFSVSSAAESQRTSPEQVHRWIDQLDHDDFAVREKAAATLTHAGPSAIGPLAEGVLSSNPEVAWRSSEILERMAMEGDEATMDAVVHVLADMAKRGKPGLAQLATEMRTKQKVFRHNRAAAELRKLGGQVAGGDEQAMDEEGLAVMEAMPAVEIADFIVDEVPAIDLDAGIDVEFKEFPLAEKRPAWIEVLEALKIIEPRPAMKGDDLDIEDGTSNTITIDDAAAKPDPTAKPAVGERVASGLLPGAIGAALRRALGKVEEKAVEAIFDPLRPRDLPLAIDEGWAAEEPATDFRLPPLDADDIPLEDIAAEDIFPGEEMGDEIVDAMEMPAGAGIAMIGGPIFMGGGIVMGSDIDMSPGYMSLTREWRGGDAGLKHLKDLSGIANLQIEHAELSDAALPHIAKLASLKHLAIRGGKFSRDALRVFHRQRPNVSIMAMGDGMMGVNGPFNSEGCTLDTVFPGSAAHDGGLRAGDKVTAIEGDPVNDFSDLTICVSTRKVGEKLKVAYERDGQKQETEITLKQRQPGQ
jgi:hypothetical protein